MIVDKFLLEQQLSVLDSREEQVFGVGAVATQ
jgi:hypothetical protein